MSWWQCALDITNKVEALKMAKKDQATLIEGHGDFNKQCPGEVENRHPILLQLRIVLSQFYPPSKVRRLRTGKSKLAELKDEDEPKGDVEFMTMSTADVAHYIHDRKEDMWLPGKMTPHPLVRVRVEVDRSSYSSRNLTTPRPTQIRNVLALADSGAQMVVMSPKHAALLGVKETEYLPTKMSIQMAESSTTRVLGMAILKITTVGTNRTTRQQAYIMEAGDQLYLSHQDLDCLPENYPEAQVTNKKGKLRQVTKGEEERPYNCPNRVLPPDPPRKILCEGIKGGTDKLKKWTIDYHKAFAFNVHNQQGLPHARDSIKDQKEEIFEAPARRSPPQGRQNLHH